jgi:cytochrome b subunit of formate dehydrogenase
MSGQGRDSDRGGRRLLQLESHLRAQYVLAVACVTILAVTGLPQKFESLSLSRHVMDLAGGIETLRLVHRVAGGALVLTGIYHVVLVLAAVFVLRETAPLRMIPSARDFRDAVRSMAYLLRLESERPDGRERQYIHKLDYWFIAWSLGVMAVTGLVNLIPLRVATLLSAQTVLASLRTHSDAAPLVIAWVVLVHLPYSDLTPRLFRSQAPNSDATRLVTGSPEAPARAPDARPESALSVAASATLSLAEPRAKEREGLL